MRPDPRGRDEPDEPGDGTGCGPRSVRTDDICPGPCRAHMPDVACHMGYGREGDGQLQMAKHGLIRRPSASCELPPYYTGNHAPHAFALAFGPEVPRGSSTPTAAPRSRADDSRRVRRRTAGVYAGHSAGRAATLPPLASVTGRGTSRKRARAIHMNQPHSTTSRGLPLGASTSSHQIEGENRWNDWWEYEHRGQLPHVSGNACRHYELFERDFDLARSWGHNAHRLSIEWSRFEPAEGQERASRIALHPRAAGAGAARAGAGRNASPLQQPVVVHPPRGLVT